MKEGILDSYSWHLPLVSDSSCGSHYPPFNTEDCYLNLCPNVDMIPQTLCNNFTVDDVNDDDD